MEQQNNPVEIAQSNEQKPVKKRGHGVRMFLRAVAFLLVLGVVLCSVLWVFGLDDVRSYENEHRYLKEKKGSMDAVYIGGSDVHAFWQPLFGWNERGIAVWNYSVDSLPVAAVKHLLIEAHKTQPQAVYIISLSTFKKESADGSMENLHRIVDYQPFSLNKVRLINRLTEGTEYTGLKKLEFYFPVIRFHSRWDDLGSWVFDSISDRKASMHYSVFRNNVTDLSKTLKVTDAREPAPEDVAAVLNEVLDYCDEQNLDVLFVKVPQAVSEQAQARMNTLEDTVIARGYPCLDLMENMADLGILPETDFYNKAHTNIHGSLKYSRYLADYLTEHYGFTDKRGTKNWESWDKAAAEYLKDAESCTLPFERVRSLRDDTLSIPKLAKPKIDKQTVTLHWEPSDGADGYEIFRLYSAGANVWKSIGTVTDETQYTEAGLAAGATYQYRVVPFRMIDGERAYGNFDVLGVSAKTGG